MLTEFLEQSAWGAREARCGTRTVVITRGYRLHGVTSFPIRRAEFHASPGTLLIRRTTA
jgi:hypothetical protein